MSYFITSLPLLPEEDKHFGVDAVQFGIELLGSEEFATSIFSFKRMTLFPLSRRGGSRFHRNSSSCTEIPGVSFQENVIILWSAMKTSDCQT